MTDTVYCPYTETVVDKTDEDRWSWDHVVPIFMGGSDQFQIQCSRKANNDIGSKIEAPMQNDIMLSLALRNKGIVGRRGTTTIPEWKYTLIDGRKTHLRLGLDEITAWDKVERRYVDFSDREMVPVEAHLHIDVFAPLREDRARDNDVSLRLFCQNHVRYAAVSHADV